MNERYLFDTNAVVALLALTPSLVSKIQYASVTHIPSVALGELYFGALNSAQVARKLARSEVIASNFPVPDCDTETARVYGALKARLRVRGRPIPDNDLWIAALTVQHDLILLTRNAHFEAIETARIEQW